MHKSTPQSTVHPLFLRHTAYSRALGTSVLSFPEENCTKRDQGRYVKIFRNELSVWDTLLVLNVCVCEVILKALYQHIAAKNRNIDV